MVARELEILPSANGEFKRRDRLLDRRVACSARSAGVDDGSYRGDVGESRCVRAIEKPRGLLAVEAVAQVQGRTSRSWMMNGKVAMDMAVAGE